MLTLWAAGAAALACFVPLPPLARRARAARLSQPYRCESTKQLGLRFRVRLGDGVAPDRSREISEISAKSPEHRHLAAGGWIPRLRMGKIIWVSPQTGCWYSEEMPLQLLRLDEGSPGGSA